MKARIAEKFQTLFHNEGEFYASAGRINLIGEHTDYNGGFGGCTINLVKADLYDAFITKAKAAFAEKYGHEPVVISVVISDGARRL